MKNQRFNNRELSWLAFNSRVLEEAQDASNPLFERLRFAAIVANNLDEFFMVRVASIQDKIEAGFNGIEPSGMLPEEEKDQIAIRAHEQIEQLYQCYRLALLRGLKKNNLILQDMEQLDDSQKNYLKHYFNKTVFPVLTPMIVDGNRPFPLLMNKSLNIGLLLSQEKTAAFATVQVPGVLDRLIEVPTEGRERSFVFLEDLIQAHLSQLFVGYEISGTTRYRITRNADLSFEEEGAEDLLSSIRQSLKRRKWGSVIRLELQETPDPVIKKYLKEKLEIDKRDIYHCDGPLDLGFLRQLASQPGFEHLSFLPKPPLVLPAFEQPCDLFELIREKDWLFHHPYYSFEPVLRLIQQAAADPKVLAIKQTLYRVSGQSPIVSALIEAAESGKQVTVLVEVKARFDEENNIAWAQRLETAGCHVIYGVPNLKTHCKILLIVRKEQDGIRRYVHMGTGNYNDVTARFYTDMGLLTCNPYVGADSSNLFNMLTGLSQPLTMHRLIVAPYQLRGKLLQLIRRETAHAQGGKKGRIQIKCNSLVDQEMIEALYEASNAGVKIDLLVRGICCLRPGLVNMSENIQVSSIVGRFLEHSRVFSFYNDGDINIFLSSADLMDRNLDRRIELMFPIDDTVLKENIEHFFSVTFKDTAKLRRLHSDGTYRLNQGKGKKRLSSQEQFYEEAIKEVSREKLKGKSKDPEGEA